MKFKRIVCVLCGSSEADRDHRPIIHYTIDDKAHCDYCIANMIRDTKTNNKQNIFNRNVYKYLSREWTPPLVPLLSKSMYNVINI